MKFRKLFENDLATLDEIPIHIQELGEVFARVGEEFSGEWTYIVNHNGWKAYQMVSNTPKYNPLLNIDDPKKLLVKVSREYKRPCIQYIVS